MGTGLPGAIHQQHGDLWEEGYLSWNRARLAWGSAAFVSVLSWDNTLEVMSMKEEFIFAQDYRGFGPWSRSSWWKHGKEHRHSPPSILEAGTEKRKVGTRYILQRQASRDLSSPTRPTS